MVQICLAILLREDHREYRGGLALKREQEAGRFTASSNTEQLL